MHGAFGLTPTAAGGDCAAVSKGTLWVCAVRQIQPDYRPGRYALRFEFNDNWLALEASYNVAPTQNVLTVVSGETRRGGFMRWGLIPHWAKSASIGSRMINARAESPQGTPGL